MTKQARFQLEERKGTDGVSFYAARCDPLGLTAYGDTPGMAWDRLRNMFGILVDRQKEQPWQSK